MTVITQCSVEALYKLGKDYQGVTNLAKTFERRRCNHREPIEEHLCIKDVVGMSDSRSLLTTVLTRRCLDFQAKPTSIDIFWPYRILGFDRNYG